jgi:signal transduction histidine kinase
VKAIAEAHHGSVQVRSTVGHGSVFELTLPAAPPRRTAPGHSASGVAS